ncbi:polysaccharide biosynthesis tyrosine autokinase [Chryseolinea sp. T2]|uniref:GumC family protein n=1 Tax=Chryseolinea sp. T2 TaxID=3129255 RepID=UPI0030781DE8
MINSSLAHIVLHRFLPYWPLFAVALVTGFVGGTAYLKLVTPVYEISAVVLIKDENKGVEEPSMIESLNVYASKKIVENEMEVIRSRTLVRQCVEKLGLCAAVFYQDEFGLSRSGYETCPVVAEVRNLRPRITPIPRVDFIYDEKQSTVRLGAEVYPLNEWRKFGNMEIRFVANPNLVERGEGPFFLSVLDPRSVADDIARRLEIIATSKLGTVVTVKLRDAVPSRGEQIVNAVVELYNCATSSEKSGLAASTLRLIEERIQNVEASLDSVERSIEAYKSNRGIVDLSEQGKLFLQNVGDNDQRLIEIDIQLAVLTKIEKYITAKNNAERLVPSTVGLADTRIVSLLEHLFEAEVQYETLRKTTAENNPILVALRDEVENLRPSILEYVKNQKVSLVASRDNLSSSNTRYETVLSQIPQKERELLEANRQQSIKNDVYTFLLQKREETALAYASSTSDAILIDAAEASLFPVAPNKMIVYSAAMIVSMLIVVSFICAKEVLTNKVLFRKDVEAATSYPVMGELSHARVGHSVFESASMSRIREQFCQLRSAIRMSPTDPRVIMVTSSISREGKSFVSSNLASSLGRLTKRVILIDFDLRSSRLTHLFELTANLGASDLLVGRSTLNEVIFETKIPFVHIIPTGRSAGNSTEILFNGCIPQLIEQLRERYDYVILDSPPVLPIADAFVVGACADMTLLVVRHNRTLIQMVEALDSNERLRDLKNVRIVFNDVKTRGASAIVGYGYGNNDAYDKRSALFESKSVFRILE